MRVRVVNETRGVDLATDAEVAGSFGARLRGLLGRHDLPQGQGLVIQPCSSVHGIGMRFPIDVVFLTRDDRVALAMRLRRYGFSPLVRGAHLAIELPEGTIAATRTTRGDIVRVLPHSP